MAFAPVLYEPFSTVRFGRVLFVELAPGPPADSKCRYCRVLEGEAPPARSHFSEPGAAVRTILAPLEHGAAVDAVVFGGPGDPLRHRGVGAILRNLRKKAHVSTVVLTDGVLLGDRDVRREAGEAEIVVAWLPSNESAGSKNRVAAMRREDIYGRHVEGLAALRRETPAHVALEIPASPGPAPSPDTLAAWRRAAERIRAERILVVPAPGFEGDDVPAALETIGQALPERSGIFLPDDTIVDVRCFCDYEPEAEAEFEAESRTD